MCVWPYFNGYLLSNTSDCLIIYPQAIKTNQRKVRDKVEIEYGEWSTTIKEKDSKTNEEVKLEP